MLILIILLCFLCFLYFLFFSLFSLFLYFEFGLQDLVHDFEQRDGFWIGVCLGDNPADATLDGGLVFAICFAHVQFRLDPVVNDAVKVGVAFHALERFNAGRGDDVLFGDGHGGEAGVDHVGDVADGDFVLRVEEGLENVGEARGEMEDAFFVVLHQGFEALEGHVCAQIVVGVDNFVPHFVDIRHEGVPLKQDFREHVCALDGDCFWLDLVLVEMGFQFAKRLDVMLVQFSFVQYRLVERGEDGRVVDFWFFQTDHFF